MLNSNVQMRILREEVARVTRGSGKRRSQKAERETSFTTTNNALFNHIFILKA